MERPSSRTASWSDPAARTLLTLAAVGAPLAVGAVHQSTIALLLAVSVLSVAVAVRRSPGLVLDLPGVVLCGAAAWTLLQAVPLPAALVRTVAPGVAAVHDAVARLPGGELRRWLCLSLDPSLTSLEAAKWASYAAIYATVLGWPEGASRTVTRVLLWTAASFAATTAIQTAAGAPGIVGLYRTANATASRIHGTLINPHHTAILCAFLGTVCLGVAVGGKGARRWLVAVLALALLAAALAPLALGASLAVATGLFLLTWLRIRIRRAGRLGLPDLGAGMILGVVIAAALWRLLPTPDEVLAMPDRYLAFRRFGRLLLWRDAWRMLPDFASTGVGRGAFGLAFTAYDTTTPVSVAWHAESTVLQILCEWGVVAGPLVVLGLLVGCLDGLRTRRSSLSATLGAGLLALAAVNTFDFSLELAGVAVPATIAFALMRRERQPVPVIRGMPAAGTLLALTALAALAVLARWGATLDRDAERVRAAPVDAPSADAFDRVAAAAAARHPADFLIPLRSASQHHARRWPGGAAWLNRALWLRPRSGDAHVVAARMLTAAARFRQAVLELRLAARHDPALVGEAAATILTRADLLGQVVADLPGADADDVRLLDRLAESLAATEHRAEALAVDRRLLGVPAAASDRLRALRRARRAAGDDGTRLRELDAEVEILAGDTDPAWLLGVAELRRSAGRSAEARALVRTVARQPPADRAAASALVDELLALGQAEQAASWLESVVPGALAPAEREHLLGLVCSRTKDHRGALLHYNLAIQHSPASVEYTIDAALAARDAGDAATAAELARRALTISHNDPAARASLAPILGEVR